MTRHYDVDLVSDRAMVCRIPQYPAPSERVCYSDDTQWLADNRYAAGMGAMGYPVSQGLAVDVYLLVGKVTRLLNRLLLVSEGALYLYLPGFLTLYSSHSDLKLWMPHLQEPFSGCDSKNAGDDPG